MKITMNRGLTLAVALAFLAGCASSRKQDTVAPGSNDLLELLTGFGESLSKRNFQKAVSYMVPEERNLLQDPDGRIPEDKQKMLLALPLQKLIKHPSIHVENRHIAGIYTLLPNLRQGESVAAAPEGSADLEAAPPAEEQPAAETAAATDEESMGSASDVRTGGDPQLRATVKKFFTAVNSKNWSSALALMNDGEKRLLLDDKGRLKESSKQRLAKIDQQNKEALVLQDGKLTGVTLLLPSD